MQKPDIQAAARTDMALLTFSYHRAMDLSKEINREHLFVLYCLTTCIVGDEKLLHMGPFRYAIIHLPRFEGA